MKRQAAIERISELLDNGELETSNTSMRIPTALRDAAALAVSDRRSPQFHRYLPSG